MSRILVARLVSASGKAFGLLISPVSVELNALADGRGSLRSFFAAAGSSKRHLPTHHHRILTATSLTQPHRHRHRHRTEATNHKKETDRWASFVLFTRPSSGPWAAQRPSCSPRLAPPLGRPGAGWESPRWAFCAPI